MQKSCVLPSPHKERVWWFRGCESCWVWIHVLWDERFGKTASKKTSSGSREGVTGPTLALTEVKMIFRWFEVGRAIWAQVSQIGVSQIKAPTPTGSLFRKYVYSSFMVKTRIDLGSFGLFWFSLGWG